ncbi:MAG: hypothetical protein J5884_00790 [Paludibacteraceae bacterium]|nr:hypothetical protein [Paludibacteraceae bacterium]
MTISLSAQEMTEDQQYSLQFQAEMRAQLSKLTNELEDLADDSERQNVITEKKLRSPYYIRVMDENIQSLSRRMQALEVHWDAFSASYMAFITDNDTVMEIMTNAQLLKQSLTDTIAAMQTRCEAIRDFQGAEQIILAQDSIYDKLYKQAFAMSFVQKLSPQLEKLKAQEQAHFAQLQEEYDKAKAASDAVQQLHARAEKVNECFFAVKAQSEKIQQMKYMPLIQRVKDYLMGLACVAVILLLFNNFMAKWQAAKQKKEALEKQAEQLKKQQNDYPTI